MVYKYAVRTLSYRVDPKSTAEAEILALEFIQKEGKMLDDLGDEGWDLIQVAAFNTGDIHVYRYFFKKVWE